ncbi:ABC transporter permease [Streptomyces sp. TR1341]|uniref:Peptide/nickel transport system permease protein n=1 Tax=Streptomyces murinus TaxID=33900 RepID=A0A7W3NWA6_STRMR|nr:MULTISPECIES: ABC transporter permease [Streptomyces]MBA9057911.1 peptide/nickel transport system permease protein [Streptomyces murinus]NDK26757.1 ABC transporter permease [Streptomyces sp. TR1341]UWW92143.1 ABC transporter permease subunit [Streptomyces murinus]WSI89450.1 ABC transporter permease [Streptomyces murinus]
MAGRALPRITRSIALLLVSVLVSYVVASAALCPRAHFEDRTPRPSASTVDHELAAVGLDDSTPVLARFGHWSWRALHGDLGRTIDGGSVNAELGRRVGVSVRLLLVGTVVGTGLGVLAGLWAAVRRGRLPDHAMTVLSFLVLSVPTFVLALLLKDGALSFNHCVGHTLIRYTGESTPDQRGTWTSQLADRSSHLVLPAATVALGSIASYSRYQRAATLDLLAADHLRTAQAKGLTPGRALLRHGLRISLIPMTTFFSFGFLTLFTGSVFAEQIFGWPGMGSWFLEAAQEGDVNSVVAVCLFSAVTVLLAGLLADALLMALDPRVRR